jgi:hypothetical protein
MVKQGGLRVAGFVLRVRRCGLLVAGKLMVEGVKNSEVGMRKIGKGARRKANDYILFKPCAVRLAP